MTLIFNDSLIEKTNYRNTAVFQSYFSSSLLPPWKNQSIHKIYCFHFGRDYPHQNLCPAQEKTCSKCQKKEHLARCCKSKVSKQRRSMNGAVDAADPLNQKIGFELHD